LIKRVRGTVVSTQLISSSTAARAAYAAKGVFHRLLPDVWIHTDAHTIKQHKCGPSPAVSILLTAESTTGVLLSAEACLGDQKQQREAPEELGQRAACALLEEIRRGGCIDTDLQATVLLLMCLTPQDVSRVRVGTLSQYTIHCLRLYKELMGVEFKVQPDMDTKTVLLSCLGVGYRNNAKAST
jgi:RNA 3'-terminal phosphate cyclase-like protein